MENPDQDQQDPRSVPGVEDTTAMTIEFLCARLLSELSVSKSTRQRADELAKRVAELEGQLKIMSLQRKMAEKATADVLANLEDNGTSDISETLDSNSGHETESKVEDGPAREDVNYGTVRRRNEHEEYSGSDIDTSPVLGGSLSWKRRNDSPHTREKYKKHSIQSQSSFTSIGSSSPKHQLGRSCHQIKRRDTRPLDGEQELKSEARMDTVTSTSPPTSSPMPSFSTAPIFKFGSSSVPSTSAPALSAPSGVGSVETKTKPETTFGNLSGLPPSETSAVKVASTGSSVFQFGAASTTSDANKRPANSTFAQNNIHAFGAPVSFSCSGLASSTQSTLSSSTSFGLTGNTGLASGSSLFGSSAPASNPFTSGATFGLASSSSSANNSVSSSAGTSSSFFNWQPSSTPSYSTGFSATPSGGFSFGLSSSSSASDSAPMVFGSSSTGASTPSMFSFTSAATATTSQPAFGNSNNAFTFGSTPPANNNEQASMEDSMAEDTVQTASPMPSFGQQPLTPPPPSSGFMFGSTAPSPLGANPFQFGGSQQNVSTPQNPSPFQASGSLDFNASAGGSFSLGAGGGDKTNRKYVKVKSKSRKK